MRVETSPEEQANVYRALEESRGEFVSSDMLVYKTGLPYRVMRAAIAAMVQRGIVIASRSHSGGGFCLDPTPEIIEEDIRTLRARRRELTRRIRSLESAVAA